MKARQSKQAALRSVSLRLSEEDRDFLLAFWSRMALGEKRPNLSRAARAILKKAREQ